MFISARALRQSARAISGSDLISFDSSCSISTKVRSEGEESTQLTVSFEEAGYCARNVCALENAMALSPFRMYAKTSLVLARSSEGSKRTASRKCCAADSG